MTQGRLIAVVGPSGVGKDSVMAGLHQAMPSFHLVRRVVTRPMQPGGEDHDVVCVDDFEALALNGAFALHWGAHGLYYGIPATLGVQLNKGTDCMVNLSRTVLAQAGDIFSRMTVLNIHAKPATLAHRLTLRGRETKDEIAHRLAQADKPLPCGLNVIHLSNDGPLQETVARGVVLLQHESV